MRTPTDRCELISQEALRRVILVMAQCNSALYPKGSFPTTRERRTKEQINITVKHDALTAARAEALFGNLLATGSRPSCGEVDGAIRVAVRARGGVRGCAGSDSMTFRPERSACRPASLAGS